jgi:hypothetical protein
MYHMGRQERVAQSREPRELQVGGLFRDCEAALPLDLSPSLMPVAPPVTTNDIYFSLLYTPSVTTNQMTSQSPLPLRRQHETRHVLFIFSMLSPLSQSMKLW